MENYESDVCMWTFLAGINYCISRHSIPMFFGMSEEKEAVASFQNLTGGKVLKVIGCEKLYYEHNDPVAPTTEEDLLEAIREDHRKFRTECQLPPPKGGGLKGDL